MPVCTLPEFVSISAQRRRSTGHAGTNRAMAPSRSARPSTSRRDTRNTASRRRPRRSERGRTLRRRRLRVTHETLALRAGCKDRNPGIAGRLGTARVLQAFDPTSVRCGTGPGAAKPLGHAEGGTRTHTLLRAADFESAASTDSATSARTARGARAGSRSIRQSRQCVLSRASWHSSQRYQPAPVG